MKKHFPKLLILVVLLTTLTSCEIIGDIFQVGMGVGIFIVVAIILLVWWIARKIKR